MVSLFLLLLYYLCFFLWNLTGTYQGVLPRFIMRPRDTIALEGDTVVLHCGANGRDRNGAAPRLEWLKDGATLDLT